VKQRGPATVIAEDGVRLAYERYGPPDRRSVVVTHGIFGHRTMPELRILREGLLEAGWSVVLWDVRGHSDSGGRFTFGAAEWRDLQALVRRLRVEGVGHPLVGLGFSFGAFHTLVAEAHAPTFDAIVSVAGPRDLRGLWPAVFGGHVLETLRHRLRRPLRRTRLGLPRRRPTPGETIASLRVPLLFVHGTHDWIVPAEHSADLHRLARAPAELVVLEGGLHAEYLLAQDPARFFGVLVPWLSRLRATAA
jgi:pimeloyl-ACP methyl ester carboxylesterase